MSQLSRLLVAREIKQVIGGAFFLIHPVTNKCYYDSFCISWGLLRPQDARMWERVEFRGWLKITVCKISSTTISNYVFHDITARENSNELYLDSSASASD